MKIKSSLMTVILCAGITMRAQAVGSPGFLLPTRYYDAAGGRFISADSVVPNANDPQSLNRYASVRNNPINLIDPSGHFFWVPIIIGAAIGAYSAGKSTDWNPDYMMRGALVGALGGAVGAGVGAYAMGATGSAIASGIIGGAAGGTASGYAGAAMFGGNRGIAMEQGALWGGISGGLSQGLTMRGVPDAFAQAGSGYLSGHWQGGERAANSGATYGFAGSVMSAALTMSGIDADGTVPMQDSTREISQWSTNQTMVVTPEIQAKDWFWVALGLLSGGYEHTQHTKDILNPGTPENPHHSRYFRTVQNNVPHPGEEYVSGYNSPDGSYVSPYRLFSNNCTTRMGYLSPSAYRANFQYVGPSNYWHE